MATRSLAQFNLFMYLYEEGEKHRGRWVQTFVNMRLNSRTIEALEKKEFIERRRVPSMVRGRRGREVQGWVYQFRVKPAHYRKLNKLSAELETYSKELMQ